MSGKRRTTGNESMKIAYCDATRASASHRARSRHANARHIALWRWPLVSALCGCESRRSATHEPQSARMESRTYFAMPLSVAELGFRQAHFFLAAVTVRVTADLTVPSR